MKTVPNCFDKARNLIRSRLAENGIPSLAVSASRHGETVWEEAFGWADRERQRPATVHTPYSLASVSKPITATALMKLADAGRIDLDRPVNDYLAADSQLKVWIGDPAEVTVRRVATHTAGLPGQVNFFTGEHLKSKPSREESIRRYGNIITPPGERYRYANFGYGILDHVIERVSGRSFSDYLREEIFLPLGMKNSGLDLDSSTSPEAAVRYGSEGAIPYYEADHPGASSVWASVHDLHRFGLFHLRQSVPDQKPILSDRAILDMQRPAVRMNNVHPADLNLCASSQYGIGWVVDQDERGFRVSHGGGMGGAASKLLLLPEEGIAIAAVSNAFNPLPYTIEREILCELLPGHAEKLARHDEMRHPADPAASASHLPDAALTGIWQGAVHTYEKALPFRLDFLPTGEVHASLGDQLTALVNDARFINNGFSGRMAGSVDTSDSRRVPHHPLHHLVLDLKLRGNVLNGAVMAMVGNMLSHWVELSKT